MKTILAAIVLAIGLCAPAFSQTYIDEQGNFFDCCGSRPLGNQDVVDESYMGMNVSSCDPGGFTNCQYIRGPVSVTVSGVAYTYRCSPIYCYATIPNPPEFFNATYDSATHTFTEGNPVTDNNGNPLQWTCAATRTYAPFECTIWHIFSTMNFTDPSGLGYGTLHFHMHSTHSWDTATVQTHITWLPNPNYVPPPPPPSDE